MLNKLLKYDLKWIYKSLTVFYIIAIIFSIFGRITQIFDNSLVFIVISKICFGIVISMLFNIVINNIMRCYSRVIRNMYKDESYLTNTLPVSRGNIYLSKILASIITMLSSVIVIAFCLFICFYSKENIDVLRDSLNIISTVYDSSIIKLILVFIMVLFIELLFILLSGYTGIIYGYSKNDSMLIKSIIYGFIIYAICNILMLLSLYIFGLFDKNIMSIFTNNVVSDISIIKRVLWFITSLYLLSIIVLYYIGNKKLLKGVNIN